MSVDALGIATLFAVVFALNIIPAFAPPTWLALSWVALRRQDLDPLLLALVGACAATSGRVVLAKLSRVIIRGGLMSERARDNIDAIKAALEHRRALTSGAFLAYAFSPFPSNYLFIAYGLTALELKLVAVPFFLGRFLSYAFWAFTATRVSHYMELELSESQSYLGVYFVVTQILLLGAVYAFTQVDWRYLLTQKRLRWLRRR